MRHLNRLRRLRTLAAGRRLDLAVRKDDLEAILLACAVHLQARLARNVKGDAIDPDWLEDLDLDWQSAAIEVDGQKSIAYCRDGIPDLAFRSVRELAFPLPFRPPRHVVDRKHGVGEGIPVAGLRVGLAVYEVN